MEEEFDIAVKNGLFVVPVGCTGHEAGVLHQRVLDDFNAYYPVPGYRKQFEALARQGTPGQVTARVLKLLTKLREDRALPTAK
jgi:hypothetical protein